MEVFVCCTIAHAILLDLEGANRNEDRHIHIEYDRWVKSNEERERLGVDPGHSGALSCLRRDPLHGKLRHLTSEFTY